MIETPVTKKTAAKTAGKTAAKTAGKTAAKTAGKTAAKTTSKTAAKKAAPRKAVTATPDEIARAAYLNYRRRVEQGLPGDSRNDWLEAERYFSRSSES